MKSAHDNFILISKKRLANLTAFIKRPSKVVEVDFDRKEDRDWFFSYWEVSKSHLIHKVSIVDPSYFQKLEEP